MSYLNEQRIIALYESRDQKAVEETKNIYGRLIRSIITNVVGNGEDVGECENDTYMALWNSIPPQHPQSLSAYISRIAKNIAINCLRDSKRQKRSAEQVALEELENVLPGKALEEEFAARELGRALDRFLDECSQTDRVVFVSRYWYGVSVSDIAGKLGMSRNAVSSRLHRLRRSLKQYLKKEGFINEKA